MNEKRLEEIKDSIILQKIACKDNKEASELINEELELYNEVIRLNNIIDELGKWIDKNKQWQVISERYIVWEDKLTKKIKELKEEGK